MTASEQKESAARRLRKIMTDRGLNIHRLSVNSGVRASVISRILSENRDMKASTVVKLANGLGVTTDYLLGVSQVTTTEHMEKIRRAVARLDDLVWDMK